MRIRRLDLLRYGHFTDATLELPARGQDLQLVFGVNEAGKSTTLAAIEDLLFGIPRTSPHSFIHDYGSMRIGAVAEVAGQSVEFRRRKGNVDTLLTPADLPLSGGDGILAGLLGGADRSFFCRMFCLDHARLRQGGAELLDAQDDVGQMLYAAASGLVGIRKLIGAMHDEAKALWTKGASVRKYNVAAEKLKASEAALREHTVTASRWHALQEAAAAADAAYAAVEAELQAKAVEERKLNRIRRVSRQVRVRSELLAAREALGAVVSFAEGSLAELTTALSEDAQAAARLSTLTEEIDAREQERAKLTVDHAVLERADEIDRLHEQRIHVHAGSADLPKRRAELAAAEDSLKRAGRDLDLGKAEVDAIIAAIPPRAKLARARAVAGRRGAVHAAAAGVHDALAEAGRRVAALEQQREAVGAVTDVSTLAAALGSVRAQGDFAARASALEGEIHESGSTVRELSARLHPAVANVDVLAGLAVPARAALESCRDEKRGLDEALRTCQASREAAERDLASRINSHARRSREEQAVPAEELQRLREQRELGWSLVRRRYIDKTEIAVPELSRFAGDLDLPGAYQQAVATADLAADRRFDKAQIVGELAAMRGQIDEARERVASLQAQEGRLLAQLAAHAAQWQAIWAPAGLPPREAAAMLEWLDLRAQILQTAARQASKTRELARVRADEAAARSVVTAELQSLGVDTAANAERPLGMVVELAMATQRAHESRTAAEAAREDALDKARTDAALMAERMKAAETACAEWQADFDAAVASLGLDAALPFETLAAQIDGMEELREIAARVDDLRHERVGKIERDIDIFRSEVAALLALAPDLAGRDAEDAALELERRLAAARRARDLAQAVEMQVVDAQTRIAESEKLRREAGARIVALRAVAGVETIEELRQAIGRSDRQRELQRELDKTERALGEDGDGLTLAQLAEECAQADIDDIAARLQAVEGELKMLRDRLMGARDVQAHARRELDAVGGGDRAVRAAADRQAALSEIAAVAEDYVRLRSAGLLLQFAVERYRREKQGPLLSRAGELFAILTGGSFVSLQLVFGDDDKPELAGMRADKTAVRVGGMSAGTADQLYLALRIAAVEDFIDQGVPLPFIADDLFINFDDARAAAGFKVLAELAQKTQVIFFTHHRHLIEVARQAIGPDVSTITLATQSGAGAGGAAREAAA
jgi:uncharacterized protein YhaN